MSSLDDRPSLGMRFLWATVVMIGLGYCSFRILDRRPRTPDDAEAMVLTSVSTFQEFTSVFPHARVGIEHFSGPGDVKRVHAEQEDIEDRFRIAVAQRCRFMFDGSVVAESDPQYFVVDQGVRDPVRPNVRYLPQKTTAYVGADQFRALVASGFDWTVVGLGLEELDSTSVSGESPWPK